MGKKFDVIYADMPWTYKDKNTNGERGSVCKYPILTMEEIKTLPINEIASDNCTLFMWITMPLLEEGFEVLKAYGFKYKATFVWVKQNKSATGPLFGLGHYTRGAVEICLIATKGKPKRVGRSVHQVVMSPIEQHSKKPDEIRNRIVELMGDVPRVELFARQSTPGWTSLGNEIDGKDIREALRELIAQD